ncbi:MAG: GNAT family N-acetyltransferase [Clostridia bacterium]|nr:GNAT family N-acetyltransferase [Clostridia bacterium]
MKQTNEVSKLSNQILTIENLVLLVYNYIKIILGGNEMDRYIFCEKMQHYLPDYKIEIITLDNLSKYEEVFYSNEEYYIITDGKPADLELCKDVITYCPDEFPCENVFCIGFSKDDKPVAILSILLGYPIDSVLYLGLFIVNKPFHKQGVGMKIIHAFISTAKILNFSKIELSVQDNNISGSNFWRKLSFITTDKCNCGDFYNSSMELGLDA